MKRLIAILLALLIGSEAHALTYVNAAHYNSSSSLTATVSVPTGVSDNDLLMTICKRAAAADPTSVPSGWTLLQEATTASSLGYWLYYRVASSEPASYDWTWGALARTGCTTVAYRNDFDTADPIDASDNTAYTTSDSTIRAGSISVTATNSVLLYFAAFSVSSSQTTTTNPSAPASGITWTEDLADVYDGGSRFLRSVYSGTWTSSGATGSSDVTASTSSADKYGFLVSLNPAAGSTPETFGFRLRVIQ